MCTIYSFCSCHSILLCPPQNKRERNLAHARMDTFGLVSWITKVTVLSGLLLRVNAECYSHNGTFERVSRHVDRFTAENILGTPTTQSHGWPELVSCGNGTNNCCWEGDLCGSNLLCKNNQGDFGRQFCAVKSWYNCSTLADGRLSSDTQRMVLDLQKHIDHRAGGVGITSCGNNTFAIGSSRDCSVVPVFFIDPHTGEVVDAAIRSSTVSATYWKVNSASILANTALQSSSTTSSSAVATVTPSMTSPSVLEPGAPSPPSLSAGAGAGIGIGCFAVVAGVALVIWLWRRERTRTKELQKGGLQITARTDPPTYEEVPAPKTAITHSALAENAQQRPPQEMEGIPRGEIEGTPRTEAP